MLHKSRTCIHGNGYMGSDPYPEGFPPHWSVATVVPHRNIHTTHKTGQIPIPVPIFGTGPHPRTGIRVCVFVNKL